MKTTNCSGMFVMWNRSSVRAPEVSLSADVDATAGYILFSVPRSLFRAPPPRLC